MVDQMGAKWLEAAMKFPWKETLRNSQFRLDLFPERSTI